MDPTLPSKANATVMRETNAKLVRDALRLRRDATIRELTESTALTPATVGAIVRELVENGHAFETESVPSEGGRPSRRFRFNERLSLGLVVFTREINGRDTICLRIVDLHGNVITAQDHAVDAVTVDGIEALVASAMDAHAPIKAIGFGLPGIELGGKIVALDYADFVGSPIVERFARRFNVPVVVENDVNAAVLGRAFAQQAPDNEVYLYFPRKYPPGAGIRTNGRLLKGRHHFAGEVAWLPLPIKWGPSLADSIEDFSLAASQVVLSSISLLDPDSIILFGEFLTEEHLERITEHCRSHLPESIDLTLSLATDFSRDFQDGLIGLTLNAIEV